MDGQGEHPATETPPAGDAAQARPGGPEPEPAGAGAVSPPRDRETPPLAGRLHYLIGGTLPPRYNDWISNDLTGPGWRVRQALRPFLLMVPFAIVFALLPGQVSVRLTLVVFLLLSGIGLGFATSGFFRNRRLEQHGFPPVFTVSED